MKNINGIKRQYNSLILFKNRRMKIAIVYDALCCRSGGERVLLDVSAAFPNAPIYTLMYDRRSVYPEIRDKEIRTTWFNLFARNEKWYKLLFYPLGILAMESLDLTGYDIVIMVTTHCSKYVKVAPNAIVVCYCFTPFRLAWRPSSYRFYKNSSSLMRLVFDWLIKRLRKIDYHHSTRVNQFLAMTNECAERIRESYKISKDIPVIQPAIDCRKYSVRESEKYYYLVVSRLEAYKRVDLAIEACNKLGRRLIVVGRGSQKQELERLAQSNIEFREGLSDSEVADLYTNCKALIFPQHEDYGLTALEANASGRPVIAFDAGGIRETMVFRGDDCLKFTAVLFKEQTVENLVASIKKFEAQKFDSKMIRLNAERFDRSVFQEKIKIEVMKLVQSFDK